MQQDRIDSICILGGGAAGWMAAAVLARALEGRARITLIESDEIGIVGVGEATIPQIRLINAFLGIEENAFVRATQASFKLGIEFNDWGRLGDRYMHAFGDIGTSFGLLPFHQYWLRARAAGHSLSFWDYSLNYQAAIQDRFAPLERLGHSNLTGVRHAYHFDAALYARLLRQMAESAGVVRIEGKITNVALRGEDGFIEAVILEGERRIPAQLFLDCSGFRALLIEGALKTGFEDWSDWLPCDRALAVPCAHGGPMRPYTQASARKAGWQWRIPLQHRVGNGHVYCSQYLSEDEASAILLANLEGAPLADPRPLRFTTGMRKQQWVKNCVALGLASGFLEPLESTSIHLIQAGISRLVSMFPDAHFAPSLIAEYNRQSAFEFERIRDFLILHYHANAREDSRFWRDCRHMAVPASLQAKMELFAATGQIYREREELFTEPGWLQVFLGQGIFPAHYHAIADQIPLEHLQQALGNIRALIGQAVNSMPSHAGYIKTHCAAA